MSNYKEPGVYLKAVGSTVGVFTGVQTLPCVIGKGASHLSASASVVRVEDNVDGDPLPYNNTTSIVKISEYDGGPAAYIPDEDYTLNTVVSSGKSYVKWIAGKGPTVGETYYVDLVHAVDESIYDLRIVQSTNELEFIYGKDIAYDDPGTPTNLLVAAAKLALLNGAPGVYVKQVKTAGDTMTTEEYLEALEPVNQEENIWRVIPIGLTDAIFQATMQSIIISSTYEERKERTALLSVPYSAERIKPTRFDGSTGVLTIIGGYAETIKNGRISITYPDEATLEFSDGNVYTVDAQLINAAFAGAEQLNAISTSRTRMQVLGFNELKGVKMTRKQMNLLAAKGVCILTQTVSGTPLVVRHQLTTNMEFIQQREMSIIGVSDYCSKSLRLACDGYIGKSNITPELISLIGGTLRAELSNLTRSNIIISGTVESLMQDADNPDTILASVRIFVPYPCNYIDIVMYLE